MRHFAFSLIELMVVIAIVALLASIAVPAYKKYVVTARISSAVPVIDSLIGRAVEYSQRNGHFASAYELGLSPTSQNGLVDSPKALSPYFNAVTNFGIIIQDNDGVGGMGGGCGRVGVVEGYFDPATVGVSSSIVPSYTNFWFQCFYWNYQGVIHKQCFYSWGSSSVAQTDTLIPQWTNLASTSGCCFGSNSVLTAMTSWNSSTCQ